MMELSAVLLSAEQLGAFRKALRVQMPGSTADFFKRYLRGGGVNEIHCDGKRVVMRGEKAALLAAAARKYVDTTKVSSFKPILAPRPGLEPGTYGLTVRRSTH